MERSVARMGNPGLVLMLLLVAPLHTSLAATELHYTPKPDLTQEEAIETLKLVLIQQLPKFVPEEVEVNDKYFKTTNHVTRTRLVFGRVRAEDTSILFYERVAETSFHKKRNYFYVSLTDVHGNLLFRLYVQTRSVAEEFIDAMYALRRSKS